MDGNSATYSGAFTDALAFATEIHGDQRRKSAPGEPEGPSYLGHILGVAALVIEDGGSEAEVIGALLHDSIEDTETTEADLAARFGQDVSAIIVGCTDADTLPKPPWRERKERYIEALPRESPSVLRVSNADKLYNARTILRDLRLVGETVWDRFNGGRGGTLWYYRSVSDIFVETNPGYLADELQRVVAEIERLAGQEFSADVAVPSA